MIGIRLAHYEITSHLGSGGMGDVYQATDVKLGRSVAVKFLPEAVARDAERVARFEREARVLASLNHPNIAAIHGMEEADGKTFLVMELVDGETLADRIRRGAIPLDETLAMARQISEALEASHEQGIVHRDLKPANIKVRDDGTVKVLDFGLAKAFDQDLKTSHLRQGSGGQAGLHDLENSPTITTPAMTMRGVILGTAAYMSPEQAKGKAVDKRADIWAFGAVLYEMLTGARAFKGDDASETLAAVIKDRPDLSLLPASTPVRVRTLIERCLERDPKQRLRDIGEARVALSTVDGRDDLGVSSGPSQGGARSSRLPWAVALTAIVVAAYAGWIALGAVPQGSVEAQHLQLNLDPAESLLGSEPAEISVGRRRPSRTAIAFSPDGRWLALTGEQSGTQQLFVRDLRRDAGVAIAGTVGADNPFFSPDGTSIGFWSGGALRKVPVDGGPVLEICKTGRISGADWGPDGRILFSSGEDASSSGLVGNTGKHTIRMVSAGGGVASIVSAIDTSAEEDEHRLPRWVTSEWILYTVSLVGGGRHVTVQRLGGTERRMLVDDATDGRLVAGGSHLVFMRGATLMAAPFDRSRAQLAGSVQGMVDGIQVSLNAGTVRISVGAGQFTVSESGMLAYLPGQAFANQVGPLVWLDRQGRTEPVVMDERSYIQVRLSPDARRAAVSSYGAAGAGLWIHDFGRRTTTKLSSDVGGRPIWTPDGHAIVVGGRRGIYRLRADGSGAVERLPGGVREPFVAGWSRDGGELVYAENVGRADGGSGTYDIFAVSLANKTIRSLVQSKGQDAFPAVSPDGKWLAYSSDESGQPEVFVQPFDGGARIPISASGGTAPSWTRDGRALIYSKQVVGTRVRMEMWEVPLQISSTILPGIPRKFADLAADDFATANPVTNYDIAPDRRLLGTVRRDSTPPPGNTLHVITNWFDELRSKAPPPR